MNIAYLALVSPEEIHAMFEVLFGAVLAIPTGIGVAIGVEHLRKPILGIELAPPRNQGPYEGKPARDMRCLVLRLTNNPLPRYARWMSRDTAAQCRGHITFDDSEGKRKFDMPLRWSTSQQPIAPKVLLENGVQGCIVDEDRLSSLSTVDVPPGSGQDIDVAVKLDEDEECYGWSNGSYLSTPPWRNPKRKLGRGSYLVRATVVSGGQSCSAEFRLLNEGNREDFRLEESIRTDAPRD